jgi:hypothetical protein
LGSLQGYYFLPLTNEISGDCGLIGACPGVSCGFKGPVEGASQHLSQATVLLSDARKDYGEHLLTENGIELDE